MTPTDAELIAIYGWCPVCHAPRDRRMYQHAESSGYTHYWTSIVCLAEPVAHHPDLDQLTTWQVAAMSSATPATTHTTTDKDD